MSQEFVGNGLARRSQMVCGAPKVHGVPVDDRRSDEIEAGGAIGLVFECAVDEPALFMEENNDIAGGVRRSPANRA